MIHVPCPGCNKKLGIAEKFAGRLILCPACRTKVRVPTPEQPAPVEELEELEEIDDVLPARPPRDGIKSAAGPSRGRRPTEEDEPPRRKPREDVAEAEDEDRPRRRRKRKPKRYRLKSEREGSGGLFGMEPFTVGLLGAGLVCLPLLLLGVFVPPVLLATLAISVVLLVVGGFWVLIVAFSDSPLQGVLCWFVPLYSIFYVITHWEECKRPVLVQLVGLLVLLANSCAMGFAGALYGAAT